MSPSTIQTSYPGFPLLGPPHSPLESLSSAYFKYQSLDHFNGLSLFSPSLSRMVSSPSSHLYRSQASPSPDRCVRWDQCSTRAVEEGSRRCSWCVCVLELRMWVVVTRISGLDQRGREGSQWEVPFCHVSFRMGDEVPRSGRSMARTSVSLWPVVCSKCVWTWKKADEKRGWRACGVCWNSVFSSPA